LRARNVIEHGREINAFVSARVILLDRWATPSARGVIGAGRTAHHPRVDQTGPAASVATSHSRMDPNDPRVSRAVFTLREGAAYLDIAPSTLHQWARPRDAEPLLTIFPRAGRAATLPFVGFAEAFVLNALRRAGVPMQRIRPAVTLLSQEIGLDHALASHRVYTDGAEVIYDYARDSDDEALLTVVRTGQQHLADVIRAYLQPVTYGDDGWIERMRLPAYAEANVVVDPRRAFGQPVVIDGGARVEDLVDRFQAGDSAAEIADDFGVPLAGVEDVLRVALRRAA
jgi:uncharacterized protein (DUF433 family)